MNTSPYEEDRRDDQRSFFMPRWKKRFRNMAAFLRLLIDIDEECWYDEGKECDCQCY